MNRTGRGKLDRREFIVGTAATALAVGSGVGCSESGPGLADGPPATQDMSADRAPPPAMDSRSPDQHQASGDAAVSLAGRVVDVHDAKSISGKVIDGQRVAGMISSGLLGLTGATSLKQAWARLLPGFKATTRIGIKVNCINASVASSPPFLKALVATLVKDLGADAKRITVWDRTNWELSAAKVTAAAVGVKTASTEDGPGYETTPVSVAGSKTTRLSRILTTDTDLTINCGVLKDHEIAGITGALKNIYGCIHNPGNFHDQLNGELAALYNLKGVGSKMRLFFIEGLLAVATGGPVGPATHAPGRLLVSADPLAIDVHALKLINTLRKANGPVDPGMLKWIANARKLGLGSDKPQVVTRSIT